MGVRVHLGPKPLTWAKQSMNPDSSSKLNSRLKCALGGELWTILTYVFVSLMTACD